MFHLEHKLSYVFFAVGIVATLFALGRTYWLVWLHRRERQEALQRAREASKKLNSSGDEFKKS